MVNANYLEGYIAAGTRLKKTIKQIDPELKDPNLKLLNNLINTQLAGYINYLDFHKRNLKEIKDEKC